MFKHLVATAATLLLCLPLFPQELVLKVDEAKKIKVDKVVVTKVDALQIEKFPFTITAPPKAISYKWVYPKDVEVEDDGDELHILSAPKGLLTVKVSGSWIDFDNKETLRKRGSVSLYVGDVDPPKPPDPKPPGPTPSPSPMPEGGFRALVVFESGDLDTLPERQPLLYAKKVRDYLNERCVKGPKNRDWRIYDKDLDVSGDAKWVQDAMKRPRTLTVKDVSLDKFEVWSPSNLVATFSRREEAVKLASSTLPWLICGNGKVGYEGPFPSKLDDVLALLKKAGAE